MAYEFTHVNSEHCSVPAKQFCLFSVTVEAHGGIKLPDDPSVLVFAASAGSRAPGAKALTQLTDTLEKRPFDYELPTELRKKAEACAAF